MNPVERYPSGAPDFSWTAVPKFQDRRNVHVALLLLTFFATTAVGGAHYLSFQSDFGQKPITIPEGVMGLLTWKYWLGGLWYSLTILCILGCHELGHYLACRYYNVDASLPYFIPMPLVMTGTLGAFIRIRERFPSKRVLFDIGIAGPIAGFVVAVPLLFMGMAMSHLTRIPTGIPVYNIGEPLLYKAMEWLLWGTPGNGYDLNMHPMVFAAWFGLLATALNLFPIGQLDGGHISYAVLGRRSSQVTLVTAGIAVTLTLFSLSWVVWSALMIVMLYMVGPHHPGVPDEDLPLDSTRMKLALFAVVMFVLCFTPAPIGPEYVIGY